MNPLHLKKQTAKQLFKNKQYDECKQLLLQIVCEGDGHYKSLLRLGNVCTELGEYANAKKYYQQTINENPKYALVYCFFAILLSEYLNENQFAENMFEMSIKIDPKNNDLCWFNYGKLMYKIRNFDKAKQCYLKCNKETAILHYHFAKLLLKISDTEPNAIQNAKLELEKATKIKPNNAKYHHEYALCLQTLKKYNSANAQFILAIQLSNHNNIKMLYDYANLLLSHFENITQAIKYLRIAYDLDKNNEFPQVKNQYLQLTNKLEQSSKPQVTVHVRAEQKSNTNTITAVNINAVSAHAVPIGSDSGIHLIIYTFDENITYWPMNDITLRDLQSMTTLDTIINIFGGTDRVDRLQKHFQRISSSSNRIKLAIICNINCEKIIYALQKVGLYKYFAENDIIKLFNLKQHIMTLCNKYELNMCQHILFIDSMAPRIELIKEKCKTYHVQSDYLLNGLSLKHMYEIEQIASVCVIEPFHDLKFEHNQIKKSDLRGINPSIYDAIKREIVKKSFVDSLYELPVIKYMNEHWEGAETAKNKFLYFAHQYKLIRTCKPKAHFWRASNILPLLMRISPNDSEFPGRYASCLAFLQHYDSADYYFKYAIQQQAIAINHHQYAYFLFDQQRYAEAQTHFLKAIELANARYYSRSCLGYARTLEYLHKPKKAEHYYNEAVKCKYQMGKMQYFYGIFLFNYQRYNDAKIQFAIAVDYYPNSATNHYWLSKTLVQLQEFKRANYHSKQTFKLDPNFNETITEFNRYRYNTLDEQNINGSGSGCVNKENNDLNMFENNNTNRCNMNGYKTSTTTTTRRPGNPLQNYSEPIHASYMEQYRKEMEIIAKNQFEVCLDQMNETYYYYFNRSLRLIYDGKMKNLGMYFNDIFEMKWYPKINQIYLISKIYDKKSESDQTNKSNVTQQNTPDTPDTPLSDMSHTQTQAYVMDSGNPLKGYSEPIDASEMERYRNEMDIIARNESVVVLDQLHLTYAKYFNQRFKSIYTGKAKNLAMYFNDLFELQWNANNNVTLLISKVYSNTKRKSQWTKKI